ncbi:hypothetical protein F5Y12DRAFT_718712 [Xylaria sp. FL1777]|nr:hypothetical protein F5Y12DRAFT_718712 [Xylaria sp. FL1777]
MRLEDHDVEAADKIKEFFAGESNYVFEKIIEAGSSAVIVCVQNKNAGPRGFRKIAVKTATWTNRDIGPETECLAPLIWAQHIVTMIKIPFESKDTAWIRDNTIITEYLENGTLRDFMERLKRDDPARKIPNRVLWAIFLCLVRACIGIAYPPGDPKKAPSGPKDQILETLPPNLNTRPPSKLAHSDLHEGNIMFTDFDSIEHRRFPALKLIDFGMSVERTEGVEENILSVGENKRRLHPNLDSDLLTLVAQCLDRNPAKRPTLSRLLSVIRPKLEQTYPNIRQESDRNISDLVQKYLFDAA